MASVRKTAVLARAQLAAWRRARRTVTSVLMVLAGLAGALGGGALVGRWCLGVVLIAESAAVVLAGLNRDDGEPPPRRGTRTLAEILQDAREAP